MDCSMSSLDLVVVCCQAFSSRRTSLLVPPVHSLDYLEACFLSSLLIGQYMLIRYLWVVLRWLNRESLASFIFEPVYLTIYWVCSAGSILDPRDHHCNQLSSGNPSTCGQLCSYWRISVRFSSWICVSNPAPVWLG